MCATSATARSKASLFALDGVLKPESYPDRTLRIVDEGGAAREGCATAAARGGR